jgi:hypothetical protein
LLFGQHKDAVARGKIKYVLDAPELEPAVSRDHSDDRAKPKRLRARGRLAET